MKTATIDYQDIIGAFRIDAEVYQPEYLKIEKKLMSIPHTTLGAQSRVFKKGIFDINAECYQETGIPFIRISNLKNMFIDQEEMVFIPIEEHEKNKATELKQGDIVLSKTACPAASLVTVEKCNVSQDTIAIKLRKDAEVNGKFLVAFLNSKYGFPQMHRWFTGNIQMHLNLIESREIIVPLFDNKTQDAVAEQMDQALSLIELAKQSFVDATQLIQAELRTHAHENTPNWSEEKSAVVLINERWDAEYYDRKYLLAEKDLKKYEHGTFLLDDAHIKDKNHTPSPEKKHKYVQLADIKSDIGYIDSYMIELGKNLASRARRKITHNDVLLSSLEGSMTKCSIVPLELDGAICSTGFYVLSLPEHYDPEYLLALLKSNPYQLLLRKACSGTIMMAILKKELQKIPFPNVQKEQQKEVVHLIRKSQDSYRKAQEKRLQATQIVEEAIEKH